MDEYIQQVKSIIFSGKHPYKVYDEIKNIANQMEANGGELYYESIKRVEKTTVISSELIIQQQRLLTMNMSNFKDFEVSYIFDNIIVTYKESHLDFELMSWSHLVYMINDKVKNNIIKELRSYPFELLSEILSNISIKPMQFKDYIRPSSTKSARN